ncbi:MAG: hypothetical protein ACYTHM_18430, partial [Planctomycetota bacterium]
MGLGKAKSPPDPPAEAPAQKAEKTPRPPGAPDAEEVDEAFRPGRGKRDGVEIGHCGLCRGVFRTDQLHPAGDRKVCEHCLTRVEEGHTRSGEPEGRSIDRGRKGVRYLKQQAIADRLRREGRSTSYASIQWPKCINHPERSTKDKCARCNQPICAMCTRRRGERPYCAKCIGKVSGVSTRLSSGKFAGFTGSYFETVTEVLFSPSAFF